MIDTRQTDELIEQSDQTDEWVKALLCVDFYSQSWLGLICDVCNFFLFLQSSSSAACLTQFMVMPKCEGLGEIIFFRDRDSY